MIKRASGVMLVMKNEKSYTEHMKISKKKMDQRKRSFMLDVYIQMIIDEALFKRKKALIEQKINEALETKDREWFKALAKEYRELMAIA